MYCETYSPEKKEDETMVEKNLKKENAKKYRVVFEGRLCTVEYRSKKHPERQENKEKTRRLLEQYR